MVVIICLINKNRILLVNISLPVSGYLIKISLSPLKYRTLIVPLVPVIVNNANTTLKKIIKASYAIPAVLNMLKYILDANNAKKKNATTTPAYMTSLNQLL